MKIRKGWIMALVMALSLLSNGLVALAQQGAPPPSKAPAKSERQRVEVIEQHRMMVSDDPVEGMEGGHVRHPSGDTFVFLSSEMSFNGKVVKGAPYSAEAVTETVQALGDGNRIVNKTSANVYRDGEGRTRRDQTLGAIGPFASAGDPPQTFFINDPVAGVNYILDPRSHTARKLSLQFFKGLPPGEGATVITAPMRKSAKLKDKDEDFTVTIPAPPPPPPGGHMHMPPPGMQGHMPPPPPGDMPGSMGQTFFYSNDKKNVQQESLGERTMEGVRAEGSRSTFTIPAGEIGNEQPINIISERWYSPELQVVLMTKHSDPRFGETTYRLTNINRSEPARTLFEVPSDYTVKEGPAIRSFMRTAKPKDKEEKDK